MPMPHNRTVSISTGGSTETGREESAEKSAPSVIDTGKPKDIFHAVLF